MKAFWRWLGFHVHDWSMWKFSGNIVVTSTKAVLGTSQERTCSGCGLTQFQKDYRV